MTDLGFTPKGGDGPCKGCGFEHGVVYRIRVRKNVVPKYRFDNPYQWHVEKRCMKCLAWRGTVKQTDELIAELDGKLLLDALDERTHDKLIKDKTAKRVIFNFQEE